MAQLKSLIVMPGLLIMVPLMAAAGGSGMFLAKSRKGRLVDAKKRRMTGHAPVVELIDGQHLRKRADGSSVDLVSRPAAQARRRTRRAAGLPRMSKPVSSRA